PGPSLHRANVRGGCRTHIGLGDEIVVHPQVEGREGRHLSLVGCYQGEDPGCSPMSLVLTTPTTMSPPRKWFRIRIFCHLRSDSMGGLESGGSWLDGAVSWTYGPWRDEPDPGMVGGVDLVAVAGSDIVLAGTESGLMRPGGTVEPGEHWVQTAARELREEAGGRLLSLHPFGLLTCHWHERPDWLGAHHAFPDFVRVVAWCEVILD